MAKNRTQNLACADKLKTLADSTRLAVLEILMVGPKHVTDLNTVLRLDQSLLSHHLKVLRDAGLVKAIRDGKAVLYSLAPGVDLSHSGKEINLGCCKLKFD
ncbi:MAG: metalloregulator ArsR/SmtB family transcription factor [Nitrospira sp.]|nr:ArsR family transcriptional regulator [Candidatus Manganitrophaceae bacterium]HIL33919.1 ArsR family transcriptional regulator [Candidatus Manganitrophaceae bacterium]